MIVYEATKKEFLEEIVNQTLLDNLCKSYMQKIGKVRSSERKSWQNSLMFMYLVLEDEEIPADMGVALEYKIPYTNNRIDMILTGMQDETVSSAVVIELKQWTDVVICFYAEAL